MKPLRYALEAALLALLLLFFKLLPAGAASRLGGFIGRMIGPRLAASRKAQRNLARALPHLTPAAQKTILTGMWDNLGRIMAEYPHLETLSRTHTTVEGTEIFLEALSTGKGVVCIGGHLGNWEINSAACLNQLGIATELTYRAPNNPHVDKKLMNFRTLGGKLRAHAKSKTGGKAMMQVIKNGGILGILIDQKYNQGVSVPFFGQPAMTNPFFVQLCQKYGAALVPIQCKRLKGARFHLKVYDPIPVYKEDGAPRPVEDVIADAHVLLERWITDTPEQWLWLHRRWKDNG